VALAGRRASRRMIMVLHFHTTTSFAKKSGDGDVESLLFFTPFMPHAISFISVMCLM
jgi:hypothetical protein